MFLSIPDGMPEAMQHYLQMWNETDPDHIRAHLDKAVTHDCLWVDPIHCHTGRDALEENVRGFRSDYPDAVLGLTSNVDGHHGRYRYEWAIHVGGEPFITGFDVATFAENGLIDRVDGFFGELQRAASESPDG